MSNQKYKEDKAVEYDLAGIFEQKCEVCGVDNIVWTQPDNNYSEYYTTVATECRGCGEKLKWTLPVN